jgi:hypothetical protein
MKIWQLLILLMFWSSSFSQVRIADVGDGWKNKVEQALDTIKKYDVQKYYLIMENCSNVAYWNGGFSTTEGDSTITISTREMKDGNIYNISAILVHESLHLYFQRHGYKMTEHQEEFRCYITEMQFLLLLPNVEPWLIEHAQGQIEFYSKP